MSLTLPGFFITIIVVIIGIFRQFLAGNSVSLLGPGAKVDQLATLGTKWSMGIIFPLGFCAAGGTFDNHWGSEDQWRSSILHSRSST